MLIDFNLALLNLTQKSLPETYLQIQAATRIEVVICFPVHSIFIVLSILNLFCLAEFAEDKA